MLNLQPLEIQNKIEELNEVQNHKKKPFNDYNISLILQKIVELYQKDIDNLPII